MNNEIEDSWVGSHSIKSNLGLRYLDNCFSSSSLMDIAVTVGGIFPFQGNSQTGAGNCFTKNEITEIYNGTSDPIYYFIETGTSQTSCTYPQNLYSVTLSATALDQNDLNCGPGPVPIIRPVDLCAIDEGQTISQLIDDRSDLLDGFKMATVNSYEKNQYQQCIEVIESLIVSKMLDRNFMSTASGIDSAIDFLFGAGMNFKDSIIAYGILVNIGDLSRARNVLNSLNPKTAEESDFIYVQDINLDYLENPVAYAITSEVIGDLYSIGLSDGPYSGYSRSLYEIFTGERLEVDIPVEWRAPLFEPKIKAAPNIRVYPNPSAAGNLNVEVSSLSEDKFKIRLSSPLGFDLFEYNIESDGVYSINPPDMIPGVYFLSLIDSKNQAIIVSRVLLY